MITENTVPQNGPGLAIANAAIEIKKHLFDNGVVSRNEIKKILDRGFFGTRQAGNQEMPTRRASTRSPDSSRARASMPAATWGCCSAPRRIGELLTRADVC